eukprot:5736223-Prymnesium_polylepis.1
MDNEVWRQVIDQAVAGQHAAAPSAMVALVGHAWAASPPDVTSIVTQSNSPLPNINATVGSLARSASAKQAADGPWGVALTSDEKKRSSTRTRGRISRSRKHQVRGRYAGGERRGRDGVG